MMRKALLAVLLVLAVSLQAYAAATQMEASALPKPPAGQAMYIVVLRRGGFVFGGPGGGRPLQEPNFGAVGGQLVGEWDTRRLVSLPEAAVATLLADPAVKYVQRIYTADDVTRGASSLSASSVMRLQPKTDAVPPKWFSGQYQYDGSGNIKAIGVSGSGTLNGDGKANSYRYDTLGRLMTATGNYATDNSEGYTYDEFGNMVTKVSVINGQSTNATIDVDGRTNHLRIGSYDAAGAYVNDGGGNWYIHDSAGMLRERLTPSRAEAYIYTADDERIGTDTGDAVQFTVRDFEGKVLSEYEQPLLWTTALWVQDDIYRDGDLVAAERVTEEGGVRHYHLDHLGTPRLITDSLARKMAADDYLPFGRELTSWRQEMTAFDLDRPEHRHFTGHERDFTANIYEEHENYLDYMHARYYEPRSGRFLEVDRFRGNLHSPLSLNRYAYTLNDPILFSDPYGFWSWKPWEWFRKDEKTEVDCAECLLYGVTPDIVVTAKHPDPASKPQPSWDYKIAEVGGATDVLSGILRGSPTDVGRGFSKQLGIAVSLVVLGGGPKPLTSSVSRWGRAGLQEGDWVMQGERSMSNYFWSGKWDPGSWNEFASYSSGETFQVPTWALKQPMGFGVDGFLKAMLGQRLYLPIY